MCSGNEGQAKIMATNMPRKDPGRSRRSGRVWKRRLQGGKVQESHGERSIKEPSCPCDISVGLILLVSEVSVAAVIGLIRCCIAVFLPAVQIFVAPGPVPWAHLATSFSWGGGEPAEQPVQPCPVLQPSCPVRSQPSSCYDVPSLPAQLHTLPPLPC